MKLLEERNAIELSAKQQVLEANIDGQQQTMQFIGREIHDNVGQKLTLASLYTRQLSHIATPEKIETVGSIIDEALADLRQLSKSLTNPAFITISLTQLLREEATRINALGSCYVQIDDEPKDFSLSPTKKNVVFRILQEFIQNSLKHAACRRINLSFGVSADRITIHASDDGKGFDPTAKNGGQGLYNMQRRALEIEALYRLESEPSNGTTLTITLPVNNT